MDSGAARVGLFGGALQKLGPIGLGVAGAIGAVAFALNQAKAAMDFADELGDTAKKLHVTTDALQEYRYAIRLAGGEERAADAALEGFSVSLGKAQQGLAKSQRAFKALGFSKEEIQSFKDVDSALKAVTERIVALGSNQQKDAIISQLGLEGLKPLILDGAEAMVRLRQEAHAAGVVMDAEIIRRAADSKEEFETLSKVIDIQLKQAFADLAPTLIQIMGLLARMATLIGDVANAFKGMEDKTSKGLEDRATLFLKQIADAERDLAKTPGTPFNAGTRENFQARLDIARANLNDIRFEQRMRSTPPPGVPSGTELIDTTKRSGGGARTGKTPAEIAAENALKQRDLELTLRLNAAQEAGNKEEEARLSRVIEYNRLVAQAQEAGIANAGFWAISQQQILEAARATGDALTRNAEITEKTNDAIKQAVELQKAELRTIEEKNKAASDEEFDRQADALQKSQDFAKRTHDELYNQTYDAISGAFDALANGNVWDYFLNRLKAAMLNNITEALATAFVNDGSASSIQKGFQAFMRFGGGKASGGPVSAGGGSAFGSGSGVGTGSATVPGYTSPYPAGGGKASGGPVSANVAYKVGEMGAETFVPNVPGTIIPNGGGMGGTTVHQYFDNRNAIMTEQLFHIMEQRSRQAELAGAARAVSSMKKSSAMRL